MTTIVPVTIKAILDCIKNANDDILSLDGMKVDHVKIKMSSIKLNNL